MGHMSSQRTVHTWQAVGVALWQIGAHLLPLWAHVSDEADVSFPFPPGVCLSGYRQFGKTNAEWSETQGHTVDVACVEGYQASIFFCLNDKPNCDPFNTRTGNLKDIHLGGLFIYEQEPESSWLTPGGIAAWLSYLRALKSWFWRTNSAP